MSKHLYESPPMKIGKHEWRIVVYENPPNRFLPDPDPDHRSTLATFQFRGPKAPLDGHWCSEDSWPGKSFAKRNHGLPASLSKLHTAFRAEVEAAHRIGATP